MTNFSKPQGQTPKNDKKPATPAPTGQAAYKSKLDEILAKAGNNNPIAAAQAKPGPAPQAPGTQNPPAGQPPAQYTPPATGQPNAPVPPQPQIQAPPPPQPPSPGIQNQTQNQNLSPNDKLQQILAMAGKTPAQRAQAQAQQAAANAAANVQSIIHGYMQAASQDPRKILECDIEFSANPGANDDLCFKCYGDATGNIYFDVFGADIDYIIPARISNYQLMENYYRGVPYADLMADMATATVHVSNII